MGFNKKYVDRESILNNLERIGTFFDSADSIICMDQWSSNFLTNYFPKERDIKRRIEEKFRFDSGPQYHTDPEYKSLKSISDCLIGLSTQPTWLDINLTIDILKLTPDPETDSGKFDILKSKCLNAIEEGFKSRMAGLASMFSLFFASCSEIKIQDKSGKEVPSEEYANKTSIGEITNTQYLRKGMWSIVFKDQNGNIISTDIKARGFFSQDIPNVGDSAKLQFDDRGEGVDIYLKDESDQDYQEHPLLSK